MANDLDALQRSYLTQLFSNLTEELTPSFLEACDWIMPEAYGVELSQCVPKTLNQANSNSCIAYGTFHLIQFQVNVLARIANVEPPLISIYHLREILRTLKPRYLSEFLMKIERVGLVAERDYNRKTRKPNEGVTGYSVSWNYGFECNTTPEGLENLEWKVKDHILRYGGLLGELKMVKGLDFSGFEAYDGVGIPEVDMKSGLEEGHVVSVLGWKQQDFIYQGSYGENFGIEVGGIKGCGKFKSTALHHVYIPQVKPWWTEEVPQL